MRVSVWAGYGYDCEDPRSWKLGHPRKLGRDGVGQGHLSSNKLRRLLVAMQM